MAGKFGEQILHLSWYWCCGNDLPTKSHASGLVASPCVPPPFHIMELSNGALVALEYGGAGVGSGQYTVNSPGVHDALRFLDAYSQDMPPLAPLALDGEFEHVYLPSVGHTVMRMALLSFSRVGSAAIVALHLPSLLGPASANRREIAAAIVRLLTRATLVTWDGVRSDFPALTHALPAFAAAAAAGHHVDLLVEYTACVRSGRLHRDAPLNLFFCFILGPAFVLDKALQFSNWNAPPSPEMLNYAATT